MLLLDRNLMLTSLMSTRYIYHNTRIALFIELIRVFNLLVTGKIALSPIEPFVMP